MPSKTRDGEDLRTLICEAREHASRLETERCALEEIRDDLLIHERDAERSLAAARERGNELGRSLDARRRRRQEIETEIEGVQLEIAALERQCEIRSRRHTALSREAVVLEQELREGRSTTLSMDSALRDVHESLRAIDRRIDFAQRKTAQSIGDGPPAKPRRSLT